MAAVVYPLWDVSEAAPNLHDFPAGQSLLRQCIHLSWWVHEMIDKAEDGKAVTQISVLAGLVAKEGTVFEPGFQVFPSHPELGIKNGSPSDLHPFLWLVNDDTKRLFIAFRSSVFGKCFKDWIDDMDIRNNWDKNYCGNIHAGIARRAYSIPIIEIVTRVRAGYEVIVTGHSLGGAIAQLYTARVLEDLLATGSKTDRIRCITFGAPQAADRRFWAAYIPFWRQFDSYIYEGDIVCRIMPYVQQVQKTAVKWLVAAGESVLTTAILSAGISANIPVSPAAAQGTSRSVGGVFKDFVLPWAGLGAAAYVNFGRMHFLSADGSKAPKSLLLGLRIEKIMEDFYGLGSVEESSSVNELNTSWAIVVDAFPKLKEALNFSSFTDHGCYPSAIKRLTKNIPPFDSKPVVMVSSQVLDAPSLVAGVIRQWKPELNAHIALHQSPCYLTITGTHADFIRHVRLLPPAITADGVADTVMISPANTIWNSSEKSVQCVILLNSSQAAQKYLEEHRSFQIEAQACFFSVKVQVSVSRFDVSSTADLSPAQVLSDFYWSTITSGFFEVQHERSGDCMRIEALASENGNLVTLERMLDIFWSDARFAEVMVSVFLARLRVSNAAALKPLSNECVTLYANARTSKWSSVRSVMQLDSASVSIFYADVIKRLRALQASPEHKPASTSGQEIDNLLRMALSHSSWIEKSTPVKAPEAFVSRSCHQSSAQTASASTDSLEEVEEWRNIPRGSRLLHIVRKCIDLHGATTEDALSGRMKLILSSLLVPLCLVELKLAAWTMDTLVKIQKVRLATLIRDVNMSNAIEFAVSFMRRVFLAFIWGAQDEVDHSIMQAAVSLMCSMQASTSSAARIDPNAERTPTELWNMMTALASRAELSGSPLALLPDVIWHSVFPSAPLHEVNTRGRANWTSVLAVINGLVALRPIVTLRPRFVLTGLSQQGKSTLFYLLTGVQRRELRARATAEKDAAVSHQVSLDFHTRFAREEPTSLDKPDDVKSEEKEIAVNIFDPPGAEDGVSLGMALVSAVLPRAVGVIHVCKLTSFTLSQHTDTLRSIVADARGKVLVLINGVDDHLEKELKHLEDKHAGRSMEVRPGKPVKDGGLATVAAGGASAEALNVYMRQNFKPSLHLKRLYEDLVVPQLKVWKSWLGGVDVRFEMAIIDRRKAENTIQRCVSIEADFNKSVWYHLDVVNRFMWPALTATTAMNSFYTQINQIT